VKKLALIFALVFSLTLLLGYQFVANTLVKPLNLNETWMVQRGTSLHTAMLYLQPQSSSWLLRAQRALMQWRGVDTAILAGEYQLSEGMNLIDVLHKLSSGDVVLRQTTILEGWTLAQARSALADLAGVENDLAGDKWLQFLSELGLAERAEGWFAPETYHYHAGTSLSELLRRAHSTMLQWLTDAWATKKSDLPLDSMYDLLILASIVEKETGLVSERPLIASVFINRLKQGMRLQTDPTVIYGLGESFDGDLRRSDLASDTPYNTYKIYGLPPTPISLPSRNAILSVTQAIDTDYLYFVAKGDGSSHFSVTLAEHQTAVRRYQLQRRDDYQSAPK
jgi:UPF0755 protein